jgi:hypothetical protein
MHNGWPDLWKLKSGHWAYGKQHGRFTKENAQNIQTIKHFRIFLIFFFHLSGSVAAHMVRRSVFSFV